MKIFASDPSVLDALSAHLETTVCAEVVAQKVTGRPAGKLQPIPGVELLQLRRAVEPLAFHFGYAPES